jgi:DMSO/TMAO reductase YedYZ heme-binding membrane subunit
MTRIIILVALAVASTTFAQKRSGWEQHMRGWLVVDWATVEY